MASVTDVSKALVALAAQAIYPNGTAQPSVISADVIAYPGWPNSQTLEDDLARGKCHVSVFPRPEERNVSRYPEDWKQVSVKSATLALTIAGQTVTVTGTIPAADNPHNLAVLANGQGFVYTVQPTDTLNGIATALAALIAAAIPGTTSAGAVVTLPTSARISAARVGVSGTVARELKRQQKKFQLTVWANSPDRRDAMGNAIEVALAPIRFLVMPDGFAARILYQGQTERDEQQKVMLYRRDLFYTVEYATTQTTGGTQVITEQFNVGAQDSNAASISTTQVNL